MRNIKKLTLSLLAVVAVSTWNTTFADDLVLEVLTGEEATYDAPFVGDCHKIGDGKVIVSGNGAAGNMANLELSGGWVQIADANSMPSVVTYDTNADNTFEVNVPGGADASDLVMTQPGKLLCTTPANLYSVTGTGLLSIDGSEAAIVAGDLSASATPVTVDAGALMQVGGVGHKATAGVTTIDGKLEILAAPVAGAIPGLTTVDAAGVIEVDAGVTVPALGGSDIFTNNGLKFGNNAVLRLRNGSTWNRAITVGSFN